MEVDRGLGEVRIRLLGVGRGQPPEPALGVHDEPAAVGRPVRRLDVQHGRLGDHALGARLDVDDEEAGQLAVAQRHAVDPVGPSAGAEPGASSRLLANEESKRLSGVGQRRERTRARASGAPCRRSIPASSHSTDTGPS